MLRSTSKQNVESNIRDYLARDLSLIEPGLVLIDDEYHLRNPNSADGFGAREPRRTKPVEKSAIPRSPATSCSTRFHESHAPTSGYHCVISGE